MAIPTEEETEAPRVSWSVPPSTIACNHICIGPSVRCWKHRELGRLGFPQEQTSWWGRQAVNAERNVQESTIKATGRLIFGTHPLTPIQDAPASCWWCEGNVQTIGLKKVTSSSQLAWDFRDFSTGSLMCQELLICRQSRTVGHVRARHLSDVKAQALSCTPHWCSEACLHPPWLITYRCNASRQLRKAGKNAGRWYFLWQRIRWGPKSLRLFFFPLWL